MQDKVVSQINEFRADLKSANQSLLNKYSSRVDQIENFRPMFILVGAVGGFAAAASRLLSEELGNYVAVAGAVAVLLGAVLVGLLDRKKLEIGQEAKTALTSLDHALGQWQVTAEELVALRDASTRVDERRRNRLRAIEKMIMMLEAALASGASDVAACSKMLEEASDHLRKAIDVRGDELFSISVLRRQGGGDSERLVRVADIWTNSAFKDRGARVLRRGEGYAGSVWNSAAERQLGDLIYEDTRAAHVREKYLVTTADPALEDQYVSVATIPILTDGNNAVWGVVFAASARPGVFSPDGERSTTQNVEMIRDIARIGGLLIGLKRDADIPI